MSLAQDSKAMEHMARFPKGVSADPTQNMSPEDAEKWEAMNEMHGDNFKAALNEMATLDFEMTSESLPEVRLSRDQTALEEEARLATIERSAEQMRVAYPSFAGDGIRWQKRFFKMFFPEKRLPIVQWTLRDNQGTPHVISNQVVLEFINQAPSGEQAGIERMIRKIDFANGNVNDYLKHLAGALINHPEFSMKLASAWVDRVVGNPALRQLLAERIAQCDEQFARFEEGESADPTENMSEEDAKKWRLENLKNRDQFKEATFDEGSRVPDGWDSGHVQADPGATESEEGSDTPDGSGNQAKRAAARLKWDHNAKDPQGRNIWKAKSPNADGDYTVWDDSDGKIHWTLKKPGASSGKASPTTFRSWGSAAKDAEAHAAGTGRWKQAAPQVNIGPQGMFRNRWPFVYAHGKAEDLLRSDVVTFDKTALPGVTEATLHDTAGNTYPAMVFTWTSDGMPAGLVVLKSDRRSMTEAQAEMRRGGRTAHDKEAATGLYGFPKRVQADCETCVRKVQKAAHSIAKAAYGKSEKVADFLSAHASRADSLPAHILVAALSEMGPKVASEMAREARLAELRAQREAGSKSQTVRLKGQKVLVPAGVKVTFDENDKKWTATSGSKSQTFTDEGKFKQWLEDHPTARTAGAHQAALDEVQRIYNSFKTDFPRHVPGRIYPKSKMPNVVRWLKKKTTDKDVAEQVFDILFKGTEMGTFDRHWGKAAATDGPQEILADYVDRMKQASQPLAALAGTPVFNGIHFAQLLQAAEALAEKGHIAFDGMVVSPKKAAEDKTARRYGLYGHSDKVARLGLQACSDVRAEAGRVAFDLHQRRASKHQQITAFLDTHCKTAECKYSRLLAASYPDGGSKTAGDVPRSVEAWLEWDED